MNELTLLGSPNLPAAGSSLPSERSESRKRGSLSNLSPEQRAKRRARQLLEAKQKARARAKSLGDRDLTIRVTAGEFAVLEQMREKQRGPIEGFFRRALMVGAVFSANAGNPRGAKVKGNSGAAAIRGSIVDKSTIQLGQHDGCHG